MTLKRRFIDGRHWTWLKRRTAKVARVGAEAWAGAGYVSLLTLEAVHRRLCVPQGEQTICLADAGYRWFVYLPDHGRWCMTAMYDPEGAAVQWYFDVISGCGVMDGAPFYDDLYLDIVLRPDGGTITLDEDELMQARDAGAISAAEYARALAIGEEILRDVAADQQGLTAFCAGWLQQLGHAQPPFKQ